MTTERVSIIIRARDFATRVFSGVVRGLKQVRVTALGVRQAFLAVTAAAAAATFGFKKMFDAGSNVLEVQSKYNTVLGDSADILNDFIDQNARLLGLTDRQAQDIAATTAAIGQGFGFARRESALLSKAVLGVAGDIASFNDRDTAEVSHAIQSALTGEREQLKQYGIVILEADVQRRAFELTGKRVAAALTKEEKATASLQLITEQAGVAIGDLARTQDSAANRGKNLSAQYRNTFDQLSTDLIPVLEQLLPLFQELADKADAMTSRVASFITTLFDLAGLTNSTLREELRAFNELSDEGKIARARNLRTEVQGKETRITGLRALVDAEGNSKPQTQLFSDVEKANELEEETQQLRLALDLMETAVARLGETAKGTAESVQEVVDALTFDPNKVIRSRADGGSGLTGGELLARQAARVTRGVVGPSATDRGGPGIDSIRFGNSFVDPVTFRRRDLLDIASTKGQAAQNDLNVKLGKAAEEFGDAEDLVVDAIGNMVNAASSGMPRIEQLFVGTISRVLQSAAGGGIFGGLLGLGFNLLGRAFGGSDRRPIPVMLDDSTERAARKIRGENRQPREITIQLLDRNTREVVREIRLLEDADGEVRLPAGFTG